MSVALIAGGAGFIGVHLARRLRREGWVVHVVDDLSGGSAHHLPLLEAEGVAVHVMPIADPDFRALLGQLAPTRVYHLAANSDVRAGVASPDLDLQRTFLTTVDLTSALHAAPPSELVFLSTSAIWGARTGALAEGTGSLEPQSAYGACKLASEAWLSAHAHRTGQRTWVFRPANVVGPLATHGVILDFLRKLAQDPLQLEVLGDGRQDKPYLHVDDLLAGIETGLSEGVAEPLAVFNVGPSDGVSVRWIAETVVAEAGVKAAIRYGETPGGWPGDVPRYRYDSGKLRGLGWAPAYTSAQAVRATVRALLAERR